MIKGAKAFSFIMTGLAAILMVGGVLFVWLADNSGDTLVSTDSRAIYGGSSETNVALMINVYQGSEYLPSILETLAANDAKVTFFIGGCWAEKNEELLKQMSAAGHEIGSHGYLHRDHSKMNYASNYEEMSIAHKLIEEITETDVTLFAPPSGAYGTATLDASEAMGYKTILWSKDTIDWRDHDTALIVRRATTEISGGDFVLMHPTKNTADALPQIIRTIKGKDLTLATVSETL